MEQFFDPNKKWTEAEREEYLQTFGHYPPDLKAINESARKSAGIESEKVVWRSHNRGYKGPTPWDEQKSKKTSEQVRDEK